MERKRRSSDDMDQLVLIEPDHFLFASESVGEGHPDKVCDQISDAILDACLEQDPNAHVACEAAAKGNLVMAFGEITLKGTLHYEQIMRSVLKEIGYDKKEKGMDFENCSCLVHVEKQEPEIATIVHLGKEEEDLGAGDQGHMFGYATDEWDPESLMPLTHMLASKICEKLAELRKNQEMPYLRPDCKSQITVEYKKEGSLIKPVRVFNVLISAQHDPSISLEDLRKVIKEKVIQAVIPPDLLDEKTIYHINPAGPFTVGGPVADAGLTGRKIIVDTYGGWAPHGGGAFSGKDATKVDRSGAYFARYVAKTLVHYGLCHRCLVQVSYAIGLAEPLSIYVDSYGTVKEGLTDHKLLNIIMRNFDFTPANIIKELKLRRPIYKKTATFGHFGRTHPDFTWEIPKKDFTF